MIVCGSSTLHVFQTSIDFRITGGFLPEKTGQSPLGHFLASGNSTEGLAGQFGHADPIAKRTSSGSTKWPHTAGQEVQRMRHRHVIGRFSRKQTYQQIVPWEEKLVVEAWALAALSTWMKR